MTVYSIVDSELLKMLVCPACRNTLNLKDGQLRCTNVACQATYRIEEGIPIMLSSQKLTVDLKLTLEKWESSYSYASLDIDENDYCLQDSNRFIRRYADSRKEGIYFEAGCGLAKNALLLARDGFKVAGLDICLGALKKARELFQREGKKGYFVCGDMNCMPFRDGLFSIIYAGGSIEHFSDTLSSVKELRRVLAKGGLLIATVPLVSLSTLTYGQLSGNIPDVQLLRQLAEFIQIRLFKKRLMIYGYEKSFTIRKIYNIFQKAGFFKIEYGPYHTHWEIKFFLNNFVKRIIRAVSRYRPFWPFIYVLAEK